MVESKLYLVLGCFFGDKENDNSFWSMVFCGFIFKKKGFDWLYRY